MSITKEIRNLWDQYLIHQRNRQHRRRVRGYAPEYVLTKEQEQAARAVFAPYAKIDLGAHNFYTAKTGQFHADYIPDDLQYAFIDPYFNDWREACYADNKCFYGRIFAGIRQPEALASRIGGLWYDGNFQPLSQEALAQILTGEPEIVIKKALGSEGGKGVYFVKGSEYGGVIAKIRDDIVIQRPIRQHADLSRVNPTSVNTIRLISLLSDEGVKIYSAILRIGVGGARVDNASSGGITCGITPDGQLKQYAYKVSGDRCKQHPDNGLVFEGYQIPSFQRCVQAVPKLHVQIPRFHLVSWDFAIAEDGEPVLVEANLHYGQLDFHQLNNGPLFGEDTEKILKTVFGK